jgi:hypothetical protein
VVSVTNTSENLQLNCGFVEVPAFRGDEEIGKGRKRRIVELSENARVWLKGARALAPRNGKMVRAAVAEGQRRGISPTQAAAAMRRIVYSIRLARIIWRCTGVRIKRRP